jgi:hypothetical protein
MSEITSEKFIATMRAKGVFAAVDEFHQALAGSAAANAERFHKALLDAYWKRKHLPAVVALGTAGIHYAVAQAAAIPGDAHELRSLAKAMSYDLGSFTWPGWDEPGIVPTLEQIARGLDAARLNLQLAVELGKPAERVRGAHWLLGAQLLASCAEGSVTEATEHLRQAVPPESDPHYLMFSGYVLLARRMAQDSSAEGPWEALIKELAEQPTEAAKYGLQQLQGAARVLMGS